jgi:hypothetical protein
MVDTLLNLSTREIATAIWTLIFCGWALSNQKVRESIRHLLGTLIIAKIIIPYFMMLGYIALLVYILSRLGLWRPDLLKDTILWTLGATGILFMSVTEATRESEKYFRKFFKRLISWLVVVEFIANLVVFPLWVELLTIPFLLLLFVVNTFSGIKEQYRAVKKLSDVLIAVYGFSVLGISIAILIRDWSVLVTVDAIQAFLLGPILTLGLLPFVYVFALYAAYESLFTRVRFLTKNESAFSCARRTLIHRFGLNLSKLNHYTRTPGILEFKSREGVEND